MKLQTKMKISSYLILFTFLFSLISFSQNKLDVNGKIMDNKNNGISDATILLISSQTNKTLKSAITNSDGTFEINQISENSFYLEIQHIGFKKKVTEVFNTNSSTFTIPNILLEETESAIGEVTVTAQKNFVTQKADRIVVDPNALVTNAGSTAFEVLEKSPSVNIGFNNAISIRGKNGVIVLINNKPSNLSADDLANYFKSIPSTDIDKIEIMNNPPAMYDAAGNSGVINILLKKNSAKGINGGVNLSYGQGELSRTNNSFNLNYRIDKWNFFTNVNVSKNQTFQDLTITRNYFTPTGQPSSVFTQNSFITPKNRSNTLKIGADFYATSKTTFGIVWSGFINPSERLTKNKAKILDGNNQLTNTIVSENPLEVDFRNSNLNLNMSHKIDNSGQEITINLDHINYNSEINQSLTNNTFNSSNQLLGTTLLISNLPSNIKINTANIDYTGIPLKKGKLDIGAKTSFVNTRNVADFRDNINNLIIPNYEFSNDFSYDENINAAYINFAKDYKKLSIQLGLRLENTNIKGYQAGNPIVKDSTFKIRYTNLFPTVFVQYKLDTIQKHVFGISLGRRIDRPNYKDLNPFTYPIDRFTFYGGNPFLQPTFSYNADVSHTYKNYLTTTLTYSYTIDVISETNEQRGTIYYSRPGNFDKQISYGITLNGNFKLKKWWTLNLYTSLLNNTFISDVYTEKLNDSKWYWVVSPTNQFVLNSNWNAELSGQYQTAVLSGQFVISPVGSVRAGISRKILKGNGSIKLNVSDIFYTNQIEGQIRNIANATASWYSLFDSRVATLSFSYRFSKGENLKVRQSGASQDEQKRVKN